jgi:hypothetical protein
LFVRTTTKLPTRVLTLVTVICASSAPTILAVHSIVDVAVAKALVTVIVKITAAACVNPVINRRPTLALIVPAAAAPGPVASVSVAASIDIIPSEKQ